MLAFHLAGPNISGEMLELLKRVRGTIALNLANRLSQLKVLPRPAQPHPSLMTDGSCHIHCISKAMKPVYQLVNAASPANSTVLLTGETGVGKDVIARLIHALSPRSQAPFVHVNCGSIPDSLIESEFFGHRKGAFTGANSNHTGFFEQADGGTIFLDEIGELPLQMQTRLLQVLQNKSIRQVGGGRDTRLDFRVVAATNCDLREMCRRGEFRKDLYYRLNCIRVELPPLRSRQEDIPILANHLLDGMYGQYGRAYVPLISSRDMDQMLRYEWPGNIRELENCLQRSLALSAGRAFRVDIPSSLDYDSMISHAHCGDGDSPFQEMEKGSLGTRTNRQSSLQEHMRYHMEEALRSTNGRIHGKGGAAELLDINPSTLRSRLKKMGIPFGRRRVC
jgi:transcriptional regulator with GAF, ATPase, and Fis domain